MPNTSLEDLKLLANKYEIKTSGTKSQLADRLCSLRGVYMSNTEREVILPLCSNNKNKSLLKNLINNKYRKKMPKT